MKRMRFCLLLISAIALVGCSSGGDDSNPNPADSEVETEHAGGGNRPGEDGPDPDAGIDGDRAGGDGGDGGDETDRDAEPDFYADEEQSEANADGDSDTEGELGECEAEAEEPFVAADCLRGPACGRLMVAAHRGYRAEHPENSLAALRAAVLVGAEFVEVDLRHTRDEVLVIVHDDTVNRTTDGAGRVNELTWAEIQAVNLKGGDPGNPESSKVPLFSRALELAREESIMLYVDQKTERWDLVLAEIHAGGYYNETLVRDDAGVLAQMTEADEHLLVMPPIGSVAELEGVQAALPGLMIVEIGLYSADTELTAAIKGHGLKVQQDVMATGDLLALGGDYSGWKTFVDAGVQLLQTDLPHLLVPAIRRYNRTGVFPEEGPGDF